MSTQQIIGAIELGVGIATGNPQLMLLGGTTMLSPTPPNQYGPRLNDLRVQSSSYGQPIQRLFGTMRTAGNVIWSTPLIETAHESSQGGKGSGPTTTNYTYAQSFAVALCEGEIAGISKIWANGSLIYNVSDTASASTVLASESIVSGMRIYTGSETQDPDSLIEADKGVGNVPAYRGVAYVVFDNLQLQDYGGRTPNMEFEVVQSGAMTGMGGVALTVSGADVGAAPTGTFYISSSRQIALLPYSGTDLRTFDIDTGAKTTLTLGIQPSRIGVLIDDYWYSSISAWYTMLRTHVITGAQETFSYPGVQVQSATTGGGYIWSTYNGTLYRTDPDTMVTAWAATLGFTAVGALQYDSHTGSVWVAYGNSVTYGVKRFTFSNGVLIATDVFACGPQPAQMAFDSVNNAMWVISQTGSAVYKIDCETGATLATYAIPYLANSICFDGDAVWIPSGYSGYARRIDVVTGAVTNTAYTTFYYVAYDQTKGVWGIGSSNDLVKLKTYDTLSSTAPDMTTVVTTICESVGLSSAQIDVTDLTDTVEGYVVQRGTARSWLEQLMMAYQFDAVESDGKIKFVKRGGASAVTIPEDDLAAREYGSALTDALTINRRQEMELPVQVDVSYFDAASAYQTATQYSQRLTTSSSNKASNNLMMALSASKAKQIADVQMYEAWTSRTTFEQVHGWKYAYLEPTDVITVVNDGVSHVMRIVDEDAAVGLFRRSAVMEDANVYTQDAVAVASPVPSGEVSRVPETRVLLLDIPLLRDQDDGVGFYGAANGYGSGWSGAQLFKSNDDGATWTSYGNAFLNEATAGIATSALGDYTQNIFDEKSSVTVMMNNGTLSSATELAVLNGANAALLGSEILQFKTATLTAAGTYLLTGLLRGRRGTEWATSTHAIGERFVLLAESDLVLFTGSSAEYDLARKYKGASFGGFLSDAPVVSFTNAAVALIPYAPCQLGGGRNAALDITINWRRRTRIGGAWNSYSDVPLGEASQSYEVDIYSDDTYATVLRTLTASTATASYTAAQQVTDFGSAQATIYFGVFQLSAVVGRGYEQRGTV